MGTHPIFESDFDCLTERNRKMRCLLVLLGVAYSLGVMSIDMGSEWFKVAIVKPGVPMEIALNKESKRKTAVAVHFRNGERLVGGDAATAGNKYPMNTYKYFTLLLGKSMDDLA